MLETADYGKIWAFVRDKKHLLIAGHRNPDGDSIAACLAMGRFLAAHHIAHDIIILDPVPEEYSDLPGISDIQKQPSGQARDGIILFECDSFTRAGLGKYRQLPSLNIDHHASGKAYAQVNVIDPAAASVCELLFYFFVTRDFAITSPMALLLFTGMASDSGFFRFANVTSHTFHAAGTLMEHHLPINDIYNRMYQAYSIKRLRTIGYLLHSAYYDDTARMLLAYLDYDYVTHNHLSKADTEGLVNFLLMSRDIDIGILVKEFVPNGCHVSLRSKTRFNVAEIAARLGGGGHKQAAGCYIKKSSRQVGKIVKTAVHKALQAQGALSK